MRTVDTGTPQSTINVTPLVDVVLVLLIIFMVVTPQLESGPPVDVPTTDRPPAATDDGKRIVVALERDGRVWIDRSEIDPGRFGDEMVEVAGRHPDGRVVIKGDSRLTFGEVQTAMLAVNAAGFGDVGLVAETFELESAEN